MDFVAVWKTASIVLTGSFGILGLLTEFKDPSTRRITKWGYISLLGIVISTGLGTIAQLKESSDNTKNSLELAQRTAITVKDVQRLLTPSEGWRISLEFTLPCDSRQLEKWCEDTEQSIWKSPNWKIDSEPLWRRFPKPYKIDDYLEIQIERRRGKENISAGARTQGWIHFTLPVKNFGKDRNLQLESAPDDQFFAAVNEYAPGYSNYSHDGLLASTADFVGATVTVSEGDSLTKLGIVLSGLTIQFPNGQSVSAWDDKEIRTVTGTYQVFTLSKDE